jgi:hypothetical protein
MLYDLGIALQKLRPGSKYRFWDVSDPTTLEWCDDVQVEPTPEELRAFFEQLVKDEPMRLLRLAREDLFKVCDGVTMKALSMGVQVSQDWKDYMQALRDLPESADPRLDENGILITDSVNWPVQPIK